MKNNNLYEKTYKNKNHFSFGANWKEYLNTLTEEKISQAKTSLINFFGGIKNIKGKTFIDIGCGSGLFSLSASLLGASKIVSIDIDDSSLWCAKYLKSKYNPKAHWTIKKGSAVNKKFIKNLGKFDIVYSWGVLHHTGDMYNAITNVSSLVKTHGSFYLAIYNDFKFNIYGGSSLFWLKVKKLYNNSSPIIKKIITFSFISYQFVSLIFIQRINPFVFIRNYKKDRGMNWYHDTIDWLGGYPYEYAGPDDIINFMAKSGFLCKNLIFRNGTGCNEYLFVKQ